MKHWGWINIYKSGKYHTPGKPGAFDRHPGDIYMSKIAAFEDIDRDPRAGYVDTVPVAWEEAERPAVNAARPRPEPVPLSTFQPACDIACGRGVDDI